MVVVFWDAREMHVVRYTYASFELSLKGFVLTGLSESSSRIDDGVVPEEHSKYVIGHVYMTKEARG